MKRFELSLLCGLVAAVLLSSFTAFAGECDELRGHIVRLHVLANSDSAADQELKLRVRDAILEQTSDIFAVTADDRQAKELARENLGRIAGIARRELAAQGCGDAVRVEYVNMFFDTRTYGELTVPAGRYDAVRVLLGEGEGRNWWCVLFPPLCVPAASEESSAPVSKQLERLGSAPRYTPKFAVLELVESFRDRLEGPADPDDGTVDGE